MKRPADIFSSSTRVRILRVLSNQAQMPIRHIAYFVGGAVFPVQCALKKLIAEKIVLRLKVKKRIIYCLNKQHAAYSFILQVFEYETNTELRLRAGHFNKRAVSVLKFCESARKLLSRVPVEGVIISKVR